MRPNAIDLTATFRIRAAEKRMCRLHRLGVRVELRARRSDVGHGDTTATRRERVARANGRRAKPASRAFSQFHYIRIYLE